MMEVVYADVLAALNFVIDYLLLAATARLAGIPAARWRLAGGAAAGASYAVMSVLPVPAALLWLPTRLTVGFGMVCLAYGRHTGRRIGKLYLLFLLVACGFAGCVTALYFLTGTRLGAQGVYYLEVPLPMVLGACALAYVLSGVLFRGAAKHGAVQDTVEPVEVRFLGRGQVFQLLLDTGNDLTDPVSGRPVLILERHAVARLLPPELLFLATGSGATDAAALFFRIPAAFQDKFFLLPYRALGTAEGLLLALRPEAVTRRGARYDALVAFSPHRLAQGRYEGLVGL